jgi:hypothetical protein
MTTQIPTFEALTNHVNILEARSNEIAKKIKEINAKLGHIDGAFPSDNIRLNPERVAAKKESAIIFEQIRTVNALLVKFYKKELKQNRKFK